LGGAFFLEAAMYSFDPYVSRHSSDRLRMSISDEVKLKIEHGPLSFVHVTDLNTGRRYLVGFMYGTTPVIVDEYK
jgi:hypothetical protein